MKKLPVIIIVVFVTMLAAVLAYFKFAAHPPDKEGMVNEALGEEAGGGSLTDSNEDTALADSNAVEEDSSTVSGTEAQSEPQLLFGGESDVANTTAIDEEKRVVLGDERFDEYIPLLTGKRVALFSNHSGIVGDKAWVSGSTSENSAGNVLSYDSPDEGADLIHFGVDKEGRKIEYGQHILDALIERGVDVRAIFSPEHGFRGNADAGEHVESSVDEKTGVPILSLYNGDSHYPSDESMAQFDALVIDMQDVGLRYYTYYISMYYLMDACAGKGKEVVILDRPNPNGFYVDGPILREELMSGVGRLPIPVVHGLTWGELAQMINGEGWLESGKGSCDLTVIPCLNYDHEVKKFLIRNPSPNLKDMRAVYLYASTCFFENTAVSVGRGTEFPFEAYGSPYLKGVSGNDFSFTPESMEGATEPPFEGETCFGKDLREKPLKEIWAEGDKFGVSHRCL